MACEFHAERIITWPNVQIDAERRFAAGEVQVKCWECFRMVWPL